MPCGGAPLNRALSRRVRAQIRADDFGILRHLLGRAFGDLFAVVEHDDAVADAHDEPHVVLDEHDRDAHLVANVAHHVDQIFFFLGVHARARLVEQEQPRLERKCARELDLLPDAVRQLADEALARELKIQKIQDLFDCRRCATSSSRTA